MPQVADCLSKRECFMRPSIGTDKRRAVTQLASVLAYALALEVVLHNRQVVKLVANRH
jgi:hypothetical protein